MTQKYHEVSLLSVCSTPEELFQSPDFQRVIDLFNLEHKQKSEWRPVTVETIKNDPQQAAVLFDFWEKRVQPKIRETQKQKMTLDNQEYAALSNVVDRSFLHIIKTTSHEVSISSHRLDVIRRGARELMNNGYVPVIQQEGGNPYGDPIYPIDVADKEQKQLAHHDRIRVIQLPQVRHNGERIEFTNFVEPEDPAKIQEIAEKGELGFTQKERDTSHISFATCLAKKNGTTKEWESIQWSEGVTVPSGRFSSHPLEQMRQYGSGLFEGIGVERGVDGKVAIFRLRDHWERMSLGGQYFRLPPIPFEVFEKMVIDTVKANWDYIPPYDKEKEKSLGRLYIRPNWFDIGPKMHVGTSGENVLMMTAVPIGSAESYYKQPIITTEKEKKEDKGKTIFFPYNVHRSTENGTGQTKADGNYGATVPHIEVAEKEGMMGVMYMNEKGTAVEETNASSLIFLQILPGEKTQDGKQKYRLLTPSLKRKTVLNSITRRTILTLAKKELGWETVDKKDISPEELRELIRTKKITAAFSTGTGAVLTPIHNIQRGTIIMRGKRNEKGEWIRGFDIKKRKRLSIKGQHMKIGEYDANNPYTDAGKDLLQVLLDAKSGALQERVSQKYKDWLTEVEPPLGKK